MSITFHLFRNISNIIKTFANQIKSDKKCIFYVYYYLHQIKSLTSFLPPYLVSLYLCIFCIFLCFLYFFKICIFYPHIPPSQPQFPQMPHLLQQTGLVPTTSTMHHPREYFLRKEPEGPLRLTLEKNYIKI